MPLEMAATQSPVDAALLSVEHLSTGYGSKQVVFDVSFHVKPGEIVGLIGHNGAGKTTAIRAVFGTLPVQKGRIR